MGGIFTTLTVLFQSAPVFLPAIGLFLSPFSVPGNHVINVYRGNPRIWRINKLSILSFHLIHLCFILPDLRKRLEYMYEKIYE